MTQQEVFETVLKALNRAGVDYMITGSIAGIYYSRPRVTHDMDIVIKMQPEQVDAFIREVGNCFYAEAATIRDSVLKKEQFNIIHIATGTKIDFRHLIDREYDAERFRRKRLAGVGKVEAPIAAPEDVILKKLEWVKMGASKRHMEDIAAIIAVQGDALDVAYLRKWAAVLEVSELLGEALQNE